MGREIERRLRVLEAALGSSKCDECCFGPEVVPERHDVVWGDRGEDQEPDGPEYCPRCGLQLIFNVYWEGALDGTGRRLRPDLDCKF